MTLSQKQLAAIHSKKQQRVPSRVCTQCGSNVSKSRARSQFGEKFANAPFCNECERDFRRSN